MISSLQKKYSVDTLITAILTNDLNLVKEHFPEQRINVNALDNNGLTPLMHAAASSHSGCLAELLSRPDILVNFTNNDGHTALMFAVVSNKPEIIKLLLRHNADVNVANKDGQTAIILAAALDYADCVAELLLEKNINVNFQDNLLNQTAVMIVPKSDDHKSLKMLLLTLNTDVKVKDLFDKTAQERANSSGELARIHCFNKALPVRPLLPIFAAIADPKKHAAPISKLPKELSRLIARML